MAYVLPRLLDVLATDAVPRLRAVALSALHGYFITVRDKGPFEEAALECIRSVKACCMTTPKPYIRQYALCTLSCTTFVAGKRVIEVKDDLMALHATLYSEWDVLTESARHALLDESSSLASTLGMDVYGESNCIAICEVLLKLQRGSSLSLSDEAVLATVRPWQDLATAMGEKVLPYLNLAVPYMVSIVTQPSTVTRELVTPGDKLEATEIGSGEEYFSEVGSPYRVRLNPQAVTVVRISVMFLRGLVYQLRGLLRQHFGIIQTACIELLGFEYADTLKQLGFDSDPTIQENAAAILSTIGDVYIEGGEKDAMHAFVEATMQPSITCFGTTVSHEFLVALRSIADAATATQLLSCSAFVPVVHLFAVTALNQVNYLNTETPTVQGRLEDSDDDAEVSEKATGRIENSTNVQVALVQDSLAACGVLLRKLPDFCRRTYEPAVLPLVGSLTRRDRSPLHHLCGLLVLNELVENAPTSATACLSMIAETAVYFAREGTHPRVLDIAFSLCGRIAPLIASAVTSLQDESALMYCHSVLDSVFNYWVLGRTKEREYTNATLFSIGAVLRICAVFPAVMDDERLQSLGHMLPELFALTVDENAKERAFVESYLPGMLEGLQ